MNSTIHKINLDIHRMGAQANIPMGCGDTERTIVVCLMEKGKLYQISEGCTAKFSAKKPDGNFIYNDCTVDYEKNTISYDIGHTDENGTRVSQTTAVIGEVECQISLIGKDGGVISTPYFSIIVSPNVYGNEPTVESIGEYNALTAYVADLERKLNDEEFYKGEKGDKGDKGDPPDIDAALSYESENPVQNKVVTQAIGDIETALDSIIAIQNNLIGGGN